MHHPTAFLFWLLPAMALTASPAPAQAPARSDYYFGDSDLEQGNYQIVAGLTPEQRAPYFCEDGLCRDSNGPVWAEHLSPDVVPVLAARPPYASLNFAVSGAQMTDRGDSDLPVPTGVTRQIAQFGAMQDSSAIHVTAQDRFFIHAGTNDLTRLAEGEDPRIIEADVVTATADHVATLAARGARLIVVAQVQPVQYLPFLGGDQFAEARQAAGAFVGDINVHLVQTLSALRAKLPTGTNIVLVNQAAFFEQLRNRYKALGFSTFDTACYDPATGALCSTNAAIQNRNVFFDGNHLSAAGHSLLADWYRATLDGASGAAAGRSAGRMSDALLAGGYRISADTDAARELMAGPSGRAFLFAAPIIGSARDQVEAGQDMRLRQRGGLIGVQVPLGSQGFAMLSAAHLTQRVDLSGGHGFRSGEWSASAAVGISGKDASLALRGTYARPRFSDFRRDTGALGVIAKAGGIHAQRYTIGIEANVRRNWGRLRLSTHDLFDYSYVRINGFSEQDAQGLALRYGRQSLDAIAFQTEARIGYALGDTNGGPDIEPFLRLRSRQRLSGKVQRIESTLIDNIADTARTDVAVANGSGLTLGGGLDVGIGTRMRIGLSYDRAVSGLTKASNAASLRLAVRF